MGQSLLVIDDLINNILNPQKNQPEEISNQDVQNCFNFILKEEENLRNQLKKEYIFSKSALYFSHRIQIYQQTTIKLANIIFKYLQSVDNQTLSRSYFQLLNIIEKLLIHLQTSYPDYFNRNTELPILYKLIVKQELNFNLSILQNLGHIYNIENELIKRITQTIELFYKDSKDTKLTFAIADYFKEFFINLIEAIQNENRRDKEQSVIDIIFDFSFNSLIIFEFLSNKIDKEMAEVTGLYEKIHRLYRMKDEINKKIIHKPHLSLYTEGKTIKEQLILYIDEEISKSKISNQAVIKFDIDKKIPKKLMTPSKVEKIGYLLRKFLAIGFFKETSMEEISAITAKYLKTEFAHNISPESLRKKSYTKNKNVMLSTKSTLFELLKEINKDLSSK